jgi:hypothetical protein
MNSEQNLEIQWDDDDYKSCSFIYTQISVETNIDGEKGDGFIFVGEHKEEKELKINLAEFF